MEANVAELLRKTFPNGRLLSPNQVKCGLKWGSLFRKSSMPLKFIEHFRSYPGEEQKGDALSMLCIKSTI
jgi:hypothetical protein